jgi:hypothetical protein
LGHFDFLVRYREISASTPMQAGDGSFESSDHKVSTEHIKVASRVFMINLEAKQRPAQAAPLLGPWPPPLWHNHWLGPASHNCVRTRY